MQGRWWSWLVETMTGGGRCHRRRKIMGRGADEGCGTEEKPSCPIHRVPTESQAEQPSTLGEEEHESLAIDFYAQASKALSERSPFDSEDAQVSTDPTLPSNLANFLAKRSDSRKRHKRSHSGGDAKSSRASGAEKAGGNNIWDRTEEYFRELTVNDIEKLCEASCIRFTASQKCFSIPHLDNAFREYAVSGGIANGATHENTISNASGCGVVVKKEDEQFMDIDSVGTSVVPQEDKGCSLRPVTLNSGLEWLLGSRKKLYLNSERPSKKRKLLGGTAGLEKLVVACPVEGSSSLCHHCSGGDTGDQLNRLIVCSSCNVAVHQRCYGVQDDVERSWLCSWCKQKSEAQNTDKPCSLCPKQGGALKPISNRGHGNGNGVSTEFAHLFCCQWIPEAFIEDTRKMEPIVYVEGIKETRRKLLCYLCKVKWGACVRCSDGTCRTSFHPICAREARHRMEIWGRLGSDDVELRAFCSKHSEVPSSGSTQESEDLSLADGPNYDVSNNEPLSLTVNRSHKLKIGRRNGDKGTVHIETNDTNINKLDHSLSHEDGVSDNRLNSKPHSESGDAQQSISMETLGKDNGENIIIPDPGNFTCILKKLIDRGKVDVKDVASDIGVLPDSLASMLADDQLVPELQCKVVKWLRSHAYISTNQKNLKIRIKSAIASKDGMGGADYSAAVAAVETDIPNVVPVKSVPPRRRTKNNIRILKDDKVLCLSKEITGDNAMGSDVIGCRLVSNDLEHCQESFPDAAKKFSIGHVGIQDTSSNSPKIEGDSSVPSICKLPEDCSSEDNAIFAHNPLMNPDLGNSDCSVLMNDTPDLTKAEAVLSFYIHPFIQTKLVEMQNGLLPKNTICSRDQDISPLHASSSSGLHCYQESQLPTYTDNSLQVDGLVQLAKARNMGILELSPEDEVEGELVYHQHKLLCNLVSKKRLTDDLVRKVAESLPRDTDAGWKQKWEAVLVNQYLCELREAKKQGRKERRHREAQAVLAAATAAAAASSRISSFRKDTLDKPARQENVLKLKRPSERAGHYSQQMPRAKETVSRLAVARISSEKNSDAVQLTSVVGKDDPRTCDVCRRSETIFNPILVCSSCKVSVHLDCYRSVKNATGPWNCELCEDLSPECSVVPAVNSLGKPSFGLVAECGICGENAGAFRKSTDGQWVHAFCAEWVLGSTYRRGQENLVEGMESVRKGVDTCHICRLKKGVCIKCSYGHCQSTFHPSCARSAGFFMNMKTSCGKLHHKVYCEKHSLEQKTKAEAQRHGVEELKSLKQVRVELEKLRLLCERIIKREKLKRELVMCSHDILDSSRESVAVSALARSPFFRPDISTESATTSLKAHTDGYRSSSEANQRSDDMTVDSAISGRRSIRFPMSVENDRKTDDSSTSQNLVMQKSTGRVSFSGKQIPHRALSNIPRNLVDDGEKRSSSRKHIETFEKELVMTSDQASMKNQRLPKGFVYVPIQCLPKEESDQDARSQEPRGSDG